MRLRRVRFPWGAAKREGPRHRAAIVPTAGWLLVIELSNQVSIDYFETTEAIALQHLAFLVSEADFDVVLGRLRESVPQIWADPARTQPGGINHFGGGRGVYFQDPDGHLFEVLTRSYGDAG